MLRPGPANGVPAAPPTYRLPTYQPPRRASDLALSLASWGLLLAVALPLTCWVIPEMAAFRREVTAERQAAAERQALEATRSAAHEAVQRRLVEKEAELLAAQRANLAAAKDLTHKLRGD